MQSRSILLFLALALVCSSCVSKKQYELVQAELANCNKDIERYTADLRDMSNRVNTCEQEKARLQSDLINAQNTLQLRAEQIADLRKQRDQQAQQVGDLTVVTQSANENVNRTLQQLEGKDKYIQLLQAARTKADSINLALAVNLKTVLRDGIADEDVEVKVDKTVVFINLSDKMLFQSGSYNLTSRAEEVLGKIATVVQSRPGFEVMVEGYTDNVPIKNDCMDDNWDLSVKRSTSVVRALQSRYNIDPNRLIAAGRGEYNALATNATPEGRSTNRRTRIIILPKLDQFYDLLNPDKAAQALGE